MQVFRNSGCDAVKLYAHPLSSYCQKALVALYENGTAFDFELVRPGDEQAAAQLASLWPMKRIPVLVDGDRTVVEVTVIIEYLDLFHAGPLRMIPEDRRAALEVRMMDRFFDNYVMTPMQKIVFDTFREGPNHDVQGVDEAHAALDQAYAWLDRTMRGREWAAGADFSLADCAAAPSLFYADWVHPIGDEYPQLGRYARRLRARPSFDRAVEEARPYRANFPLSLPAPDCR
jgi:glutathione S-transferase